MSKGTVVQVIGAVIDVEFSKEELPKIYDALVVKEADLILEVQQQLGDGVVRTIAMGITEGLKRGAEAENTGEPVTVPVGEKTLGRILNVLGKPIDGKGEVGEKERMPIHRNPPSYEEQAESPYVSFRQRRKSRSIWWSWCWKNCEHDGAHSKHCL